VKPQATTGLNVPSFGPFHLRKGATNNG
jgi:hypothetical protein